MRGPVVLFQLGEAPPPVADVHGTYATWFERAWGGPLVVVDGRAPGARVDVRGAAGIVVTGSPASLVDGERAPFADGAAAMVHAAHDAGTPVLGVCFGHQLLAWAFGGRVVVNPRGWEIGTHHVDVTDEGATDPLFAGVARRLRVNLTHRDEVVDLPAAIRVLATNPWTGVQALAIGEHLRGIQFHPEITGPIVRAYAEARRGLLVDQDVEALLASACDAPDAIAVLRAFRALVERA